MSQYPTPAESHHQPSVSPQYKTYPAREAFNAAPAPSNHSASYLPASPPFSCTASQTEASAFPSPQFSVSTPPASVPMSVERSIISHPPSFTATTDPDHVMPNSGDPSAPAVSLSKRKFEDVDVGAENDHHKRRRTDHDRQELGASNSGEAGTRIGLSPLYKLCQTRKAPFRALPACVKLHVHG